MALVFVGIGSSLNKCENIRLGLKALRDLFSDLHLSPIYESEAVGFEGGNFYNLVVSFSTSLCANDVIAQLKKIERQQGRPKHTVKFAPRTLDLDLLLHDQLVDLSIDVPRAEILNNAFVLQPLADLAPTLQHPISDETYQALWENFPKQQQKLWQIDVINN